jgi:hypothetical protein
MGMFHVLRTLVGVLPGSVGEHLGMLVPGEGLLLGTNLSVAVLQAQPFAASYACFAQKQQSGMRCLQGCISHLIATQGWTATQF